MHDGAKKAVDAGDSAAKSVSKKVDELKQTDTGKSIAKAGNKVGETVSNAGKAVQEKVESLRAE